MKVATSGNESLWSLRIHSPNAHLGEPYQPVQENDLEAALSHVGVEFTNFTFVDIGCGKGKAILIAARYGFAQLVGVEFSYELAEVARRNVALKQIRNAEIVTDDATLYEFPSGPIVVFMFNPFKGEIMRKVLLRLAQKTDAPTILIYNNPRQSAVVAEFSAFKLLKEVPTDPPSLIWQIEYDPFANGLHAPGS